MNDSAELRYDFFAPQQIVFGWGRRTEIGQLASRLGRRAFVVEGSRTLKAAGAMDEIAGSLRAAGVEPLTLAAISYEPEVADIDNAAKKLCELGAGPGDFLLAIGGGSAIDLAKAAGAMAVNRESETVKDYLEGVGRGLKLVERPLPVAAMPTTGGTGTEATKNAVISSYEPPFKKSLRSEWMVPKLVLVDPELSIHAPPRTTAWTGMDAITQLVESYICRFARAIPQALAIDGLQRALPALPVAVKDGASRPARESMSHAALLSGVALANSGLGLAHGVAAALGVTGRVPHGLACAAMLPAALRVNREISQTRLAELARATLDGVFADDSAAADAFIARIDRLAEEVGVPRRLGDLGVKREQIPELVRGSRGNSMSGNPRQLDDEELARLLESLL